MSLDTASAPPAQAKNLPVVISPTSGDPAALTESLSHLWPLQRPAAVAVITELLTTTSPFVLGAPTGSGKTVIGCAIIKWFYDQAPGIYIVTCRDADELCRHWLEEFKKIAPDIPCGYYTGKRKDHKTARVLFATVQTLYKNEALIAAAMLVLIDEGDQADFDSIQYRKILKFARRYWGMTATGYRLVGGHTVPIFGSHDGAVFSKLVYEIHPRDLIRAGQYCPAENIAPSIELDVSRLKTRAGEYVCSIEACDPEMVRAVVRDTRLALHRIGGDRQFVVFAVGQGHASQLNAEFNARGLKTATVLANTPSKERAENFAAFKRGEIQGLISVGVLGRGFDHKPIELVVITFATKSRARLVQACGRGSRACGSKTNYYLLDYGSNIERFGSPDFSMSEAIAFDARKMREAEEAAARAQEIARAAAQRIHLVSSVASRIPIFVNELELCPLRMVGKILWNQSRDKRRVIAQFITGRAEIFQTPPFFCADHPHWYTEIAKTNLFLNIIGETKSAASLSPENFVALISKCRAPYKILVQRVNDDYDGNVLRVVATKMMELDDYRFFVPHDLKRVGASPQGPEGSQPRELRA